MYNNDIMAIIGDVLLILLSVGAIIFLVSLIESMIYSKIQEIKFRRKQKKAINDMTDKFQNQLSDMLIEILKDDKDK